ncbi:hypothetical protein SAMN06298216_1993 [Spirosomataceae bacterium TFI 002]|nr:hypothetical protein SAMN06298216_1993 [Spirosomataceae bacterium TFI 002]
MLQSLFFWKTWSFAEKAILFICFLFLLLGMVFSLAWYYNGLYAVINWDIATELGSKVIQKPSFSISGLEFTLPETLYYVKEYYLPSALQVKHLPAVFLVTSLFFGLVSIASGISNQKGIYFLSGIVIIAAFFLFLRLENVFNTTNQLPFLITFGVVGGLAYYFSSFKPFTPFVRRFLIFSVVVGLIVASIFVFSKALLPVNVLGGYGIVIAIIFSLIFIFWVAQEIFIGLIWMVGQASIKGKSSSKPFWIIGIIYILNCLLIYLENRSFIENSFVIISPIYILILSAVLGIWSLYKYLEDVDVMSFRGSAIWIYFGLGIITFGAVSYAYATGNDPLIEFYDDYIAATFLIVGICLFIHALINFSPLLKNGYNLFVVFWKPKMSKLILARVGAILLLLFALSQRNFYAFDQVMAGLQNAQADYYLAIGEDKAAESFFKESTVYDIYNHKANYGLASLSNKVNDAVSSSYYYKQANFRKGSEFSYVGLGSNLENEQLFFDAIFTLQEGLQKFPGSAPLSTNLARLMERAKQVDSSFYYKDQALNLCYKCKVEETNMQAFWIENGREEMVENELKKIKTTSYISSQANQLATDRWLKDSSALAINSIKFPEALSVAQFATLFNSVKLGREFPDSILTKMQQNGANQFFAREITYLRAINSYNNGNKIDGIKKLSYLAMDTTSNSIIYRKQLAVWYLQEGLYDRAANFFAGTGDNETVAALENEGIRDALRRRAEVQAIKASSDGINMENYKSLVQKYPFNPYLLQGVSDMLVAKGKKLEAYNIWLNASEFNDRSVDIWKNYTLLALQNGVRDYAENGLRNVKLLSNVADYNEFYKKYEAMKAKTTVAF